MDVLMHCSDRSRRKVDNGKQVIWPQPLRQDANVAVIGGGLAGLSCALELARLGMRSVLFDTGEHGTGG